RAQLVCDVRGEARQTLEGLLQPIEHLVEGRRQRLELGGKPPGPDALVQRRGADPPGRLGETLQRTDPPPRDQAPDEDARREGEDEDGPETPPVAREQRALPRQIHAELKL